NSLIVAVSKPEKVRGVSISVINGDEAANCGDTPALITLASRSPGISKAARVPGFSGDLAPVGRDLSKSLISVINSMGVMPQIASGEKTERRRATAPISFPLM